MMEVESVEHDVTNSLDLLIMDEAGKPLFSTLTDEAEAGRCAALIQVARSNLLHHPTLNHLGDLQEVKCGKSSVTIQAFDSVTLVAISRGDRPQNILAKRFLWFVRAKLVSTMTSQIHLLVRSSSNVDWDRILVRKSAVNQHNVTQTRSTAQSQLHYQPITLVAASIQMFGPLKSTLRHALSLALKDVAKNTQDTIFAMLLVGREVVSIVQDSRIYSQVRSSPELNLLVACIEEQHTTGAGDLWLPICFPCISTDGFLHCFAQRFDHDTGLTIAFASQNSSMLQFQRFRDASKMLREQMGLRCHADGIAEDEDYELVPHNPMNTEVNLLEAIRGATREKVGVLHHLLGTDCLHFAARRVFAVQGRKESRRRPGSSTSQISQVITGGSDGNGKVWETYARLGLILRNGSDLDGVVKQDKATVVGADTYGQPCLDQLPPDNSIIYEQHSGFSFVASFQFRLEL